MTAAERQKRYRDKKRREREAQLAVKRERRRKADRDRKRAERAAVKAIAVATLPAAPVMRFGLVAWCDALTVTKGEGEPLRLLEWERAFLRAVEAGSAAGGRTDRDRYQRLWHGSASKRPPTAEYGLSVPAGAGKTTLAAAVAGPPSRRGNRHAAGLAGSWRRVAAGDRLAVVGCGQYGSGNVPRVFRGARRGRHGGGIFRPRDVSRVGMQMAGDGHARAGTRPAHQRGC